MSKMVYPDSLWDTHIRMANSAAESSSPWEVKLNQDNEPIAITKDGFTLLDLVPSFRTECAVNLVVMLLNKYCPRGYVE